MKEIILWIFCLAFLNASCGQSPKQTQMRYPENVGDIPFDKESDDPNFKVCNEQRSFQYYNSPKGFPFEGEKIALIEIGIGLTEVD